MVKSLKSRKSTLFKLTKVDVLIQFKRNKIRLFDDVHRLKLFLTSKEIEGGIELLFADHQLLFFARQFGFEVLYLVFVLTQPLRLQIELRL